MWHKKISSRVSVSASRLVARLAVLVVALTGVVAAQGETPHRWTVNVAGGFSPIVGALDKRLDNGWHITLGGGYKVSRRVAIGGQVMYNGFGVGTRVLRELAVPNGNAHLWAFTAEPRLDLAPGHKVSPYLIGGVGYYRRVVQFTQPTTITVIVSDPFFGFVPVLIPADKVLGTIVHDGIGGSAGFGFNIPIGNAGGKFFTEARFHYSDTDGIPLRMVPLTIGIRF